MSLLIINQTIPSLIACWIIREKQKRRIQTYWTACRKIILSFRGNSKERNTDNEKQHKISLSHYTFPANVSQGPDMYPEIFNIPSDTSNSCSVKEGSRPRPLFNNGRGEDEGCAHSNSSSLYLEKKKCDIINPERQFAYI